MRIPSSNRGRAAICGVVFVVSFVVSDVIGVEWAALVTAASLIAGAWYLGQSMFRREW